MIDKDAISDSEAVRLSLEHKDAYLLVVERYEKKLSSYIRKLGIVLKEDVQDVLQDVFVKAYQNLNAFDRQLSLSTWLYRITHNETMSFFRRRKVRPDGHTELNSEEILTTLQSADNLVKELDSRYDSSTIARAIEKLPELYKEVIVLAYFEHKKYEEISDIIQVSPNTVATRISRAKSRLKEVLLAKGFTYL